MSPNLFAEIAVSDFDVSLAWYRKLLDAEPTFFPHETEAVWQPDEGRLVYIVERPEHAGHALHTTYLDPDGSEIAFGEVPW